jgi:sugar/nucleoside kinase (ribokinase family)
MKEHTAAIVAIVGNLNLDLRTSPITPSAAILADGETSAERITETVGGGGANTAAAAAVLGGRAHFCCAIGRDELGRRLVGFLESMGVAMHPAVKPVATGRSLALTWDTHQRHFVSSLPNTHLLEETDVDLEALRRYGCRQLYRADVWFAEGMLPEGNASLMRRAREAGMETSLDINWDPVWGAGADGDRSRERRAWLRAALPFVSFVHGNERELAVFTGAASTQESVRLLREWGAGAVVVHRGAQGCAAATAGGWLEVPPVSVTRIVNETGTGDVFTAAFLLAQGMPLEDRLRSGAAAAASHLQGTRELIPPLG